MSPQADDTGLGSDTLGAPEIGDFHVDIGHPAILAAEMLEDLNGKAAIMFDVLSINHGKHLSRLGNPSVRRGEGMTLQSLPRNGN